MSRYLRCGDLGLLVARVYGDSNVLSGLISEAN